MARTILDVINQFLNQKHLSIHRFFKEICSHFENVPGFGRYTLSDDCCIYHYSENHLNLSYEPNFIKIYTDDILANSYDQRLNYGVRVLPEMISNKLDICSQGAQKLFSILQQFQNLIYFPQLEFYSFNDNSNDTTALSQELFLISKKDTENIICFEIGKDYIMPLACSFTNLEGKFDPSLNILWNFKLLNCYFENGKYEINDFGEALTLADLDLEDCSLVEKNMDHFNFSRKLANYSGDPLFEKDIFNALKPNSNFQPKKLKDCLVKQPLKLNEKNSKINFNDFLYLIFILSHFVIFSTPLIAIVAIFSSFSLKYKKQKGLSIALFTLLIFTFAIIYLREN